MRIAICGYVPGALDSAEGFALQCFSFFVALVFADLPPPSFHEMPLGAAKLRMRMSENRAPVLMTRVMASFRGQFWPLVDLYLV